MNSNSLVRSGSSQFIFQLHCSKSKPWMNFEIASLNGREHRAWFRTPSIQEGTPQARNPDFPSILAKRLIQRQGGQKLSWFVSFPKRGDASSNQPLNLTLGRMVLAYSPIGLNGQLVTSGEGHEGKGIIRLAFQSHPRVPERATCKSDSILSSITILFY